MSLWNRLLGRGRARRGERAGGPGDRGEAIAAERKPSGTVLRRDAPADTGPPPAAAQVQPASDSQARTIGGFPVKRGLGKGMMGAVYLVRHPSWNVDVALKVPQPKLIADEHNRHRITREAEAWTELGLHPNIAYCYYVKYYYDVQLKQNLLHVLIEYVDGGNLADWIAAGRRADLETVLDLAIQFCHGLEHAHDHRMIHRDIKPANVLVTREGQLKITDFGLVRAGTKDSDRSHQGIAANPVPAGGTDIAIGTYEYMAPEQWVTGELDARTDLFAFGVCLYEMLCRRRPYEIAAGLRQEAPDPAALRGDHTLPSALCALMKRCVDWAPQNRPSSAKEIREQLCQIYEQQFNEPSAYAELPQFSVAAAALNNRALSYLELGKTEEAERSWQAALEADRRHIETIYNYGLHLWRTARLTDDALIRRIEEACADGPADWLSKLLQAQVYLESGDGESAKRVLEDIPVGDAQREQVLSARRIAEDLIASCGQIPRTFLGHLLDITSVCLSADGRFALSGSMDAKVKHWDVSTGQCLRTFTGHTSSVRSVCLSADGRYALSGSLDKTLKLWRVETGECLRTFLGHTDHVTSVCLSVDGRYALSGSDDKALKLWRNDNPGLKIWEDDNSGCLRTLIGHAHFVNSLCLSADGREAISGSWDCTLKLWNVETGECRRTFTGHRDGLRTVSLSANGSRALSGSWDDTLKVWNVETGECIRTFIGHTNHVYSASLSADGRYALSGSYDRTVKLWHVEKGRCLRSFTGHTSPVNSVDLSADGRYALSGSGDKTLKLWRLPTRYPVSAFQLSLGAASGEAIQAGARFRQALKDFGRALEEDDSRVAHSVLQGARAGDFRRHPDAFEAWSRLYIRMQKTRLHDHWRKDLSEEDLDSCCFSIDARYALSGSWDSKVKPKLWELATGQHLGIIDQTISYSPICLSADGRYATSCGSGWEIKLWEVATGQCLRSFAGHGSSVKSVCLSADGRYVLSGSLDQTLKLWNFETGECLRTLGGHGSFVNSVCLSADGRYALSGGGDHVLKLWNVSTGECLYTFSGHDSSVYSICLGADGRHALSGGYDRTIKLWEIANGACLRTFKGHADAVMSVSLSADGRYAVSASHDQTVKLWEVATGECLWTFAGHTKHVRDVCLSADSRYMLSAGADGLKLWHLDWELEETEPADWDEGARPYLEVFLRAQQPYAAALPQGRTPSEEEITAALTRTGEPIWTEEDFNRLLYTLGCAGYGWLRPEGIRQQLQAMRGRPETFEETGSRRP